jgi:hypothetical protein
VIAGFAGSRAGPIVATGITAAAGELAVIDSHLQPGRGAGVTAVARCAGHYVIGSFAGGDVAVVTVFASIAGLAMVYGQSKRPPTGTGGMTTLTQVGRQRMRCRFIGSISPGVTRRATVRRLSVIERRDQRQEQICSMTGIAYISGHRMSRALAWCNSTVVAVAALVGGMVMSKRHDHRYPSIGGMASLA